MATSCRKRRARVWPLLMLTVTVLAMLASLHFALVEGQRLAWQDTLEQASPDEARDLLRQIVGRGDGGLELAVAALQSPREEIVSIAQAELYEQTARWKLLTDEQANRRRQHLAGLLAERIRQLSPAGRRAASELAVEFLRGAAKLPLSRASDLTVACQRILQGSMADLAAGRTAPKDEQSWAAKRESEHRMVAWQEVVPEPSVAETRQSSNKSTSAPSIKHTPSGPSSAPLPAAPKTADTVPQRPPAAVATAAPALLPVDMTHARPLEQPPSVAIRQRQVEIERSPPSPRLLPDVADVAAPIPLPIDEPIESRLETMQLVERLRTSDAAASERARQELRWRGFTALEFELSRRLTDPDRQVRLRWLQALPGMSQIDARPWLLWLSRDGDAEVRRAALTLMATSNEPQMMRRVAQMAREEIDPQVRSQAEKAVSPSRRTRR